MAGGNEVFGKAIPMNSIGFFGLHIMTAGTYEGEMYEEKSDSTLKRLFTKDGLLKGFNQINNTAGTIKLCAGGISLSMSESINHLLCCDQLPVTILQHRWNARKQKQRLSWISF